MTYVNIEWNYNEVQSIMSALDRASTSLKKVPTPSTANTGSAHHATLVKHLTALDTTISQMAWIANGIALGLGAATEDFKCTDDAAADFMREIQRYNDVYTHRYPVRPSIGQKPAGTSSASPR